jgi:hypothetical protein
VWEVGDGIINVGTTVGLCVLRLFLFIVVAVILFTFSYECWQ